MMDKQTWFFHKMENDSASKRKEILTLAIPWMDPKDMMLSERSQTQKDKCCLIPLTGGPQRSHIHRDRK